MNLQDILNPDFTSMGLPQDQQANPPPGFSGSMSSVQRAPAISSNQGIWQTIKDDASSAVNWVEDAAVSGAHAVKSGAGSMINTIEQPIADAAKTTYMYVLLGVVVLAGALYFIGKGGGIGQAAGFMPK